MMSVLRDIDADKQVLLGASYRCLHGPELLQPINPVTHSALLSGGNDHPIAGGSRINKTDKTVAFSVTSGVCFWE